MLQKKFEKLPGLSDVSGKYTKRSPNEHYPKSGLPSSSWSSSAAISPSGSNPSFQSPQTLPSHISALSESRQSIAKDHYFLRHTTFGTHLGANKDKQTTLCTSGSVPEKIDAADQRKTVHSPSTRYNTKILSPSWSSFLSSAPSEQGSFTSHIPLKPLEANARFKKYNEIVKSSSSGSVSRLNLKPTGIILGTPSSPRAIRLNSKSSNVPNLAFIDETQRQQRIPQREVSTAFHQTYTQHLPQYHHQYQPAPSQSVYSGETSTPSHVSGADDTNSARPSVLVRPMSLPLHLKSLKSGCAFKEPYHTNSQSPGLPQKPSVGLTQGSGSSTRILNSPGTLVTSPTITTRPGAVVVEKQTGCSTSMGIPAVFNTGRAPLPSGIPKAKAMQNQQSEQNASLTSKYQNLSNVQQQLMTKVQFPVYQPSKPTSSQSRLYGAQPRHSSCGSVGQHPMSYRKPTAMPGPQYLQCALEQYISDLLTGECHLLYKPDISSTGNSTNTATSDGQDVWRDFEHTIVPGTDESLGPTWQEQQHPANQIEALKFLEQRIQNALTSLQQKMKTGRYTEKPSRDRSFSFAVSLPAAGGSSTTARPQLRCSGQPESGLVAASTFDPYVNANSDGSPISLASPGYESAANRDPHQQQSLAAQHQQQHQQQQQACYNQLYARDSLTNVAASEKSPLRSQSGSSFDGSMLDQFSEDELRYLLAAVKDLVDLRCATEEALAPCTSFSESKASPQSSSTNMETHSSSSQVITSKCDFSITTALMHQRLPLGFQNFERYLDSKFGPDQSGQSAMRQSLETASHESEHAEWADYLAQESSLVAGDLGQRHTVDTALWYPRQSDAVESQSEKISEVNRPGSDQQPPARPPRSAARIAEPLVSPTSVEANSSLVASNLPDTTSMQSLQSPSLESYSPTYPLPPRYLLEQSTPADFYLSFPHHVQPMTREPMSPPRPPRSPVGPALSRSQHTRPLASPPLPGHSKLSARMIPSTGPSGHRDKPASYHYCLHRMGQVTLGQPHPSHVFLHAHSHQHHGPQYHNSQQPQQQQLHSYCSTPEAPEFTTARDRWCPTPPLTSSGQVPAFAGYQTPLTGHCGCHWSGPVNQELLATQLHQRNSSLEGPLPSFCYACCASDHLTPRHRPQQTSTGAALSSPDECCPLASGAMTTVTHEAAHASPLSDCRLESPPNSYFYRAPAGGLTELLTSRCCQLAGHGQEQPVAASRCLAPHNLAYPAGARMPRSESAGAGFTYGLEVNGTTSPSHWGFPSSHFSRENSVGPDYSGQRGWSPVCCGTPVRMLARQTRLANESLDCAAGLPSATAIRSMSNSLSANDLAAYLSGHTSGGSTVESRQTAKSSFNLMPHLPSEPALTLIDCTNFFSKVSAFVEIDRNLRTSLPPGWSEDRSSTGRMYYYYCYCTSSTPGGEVALRQLATWHHPLIGHHVPLAWERVDSSHHGVYYQNLLIPHCQRHHPNLWLQTPVKSLATEQEAFFSDLRNLQFSMKHNPSQELGKQLRILEYKNATTDAEEAAFAESFSQIKEVEAMVEATYLLDQLFYKELRDLIIAVEYERIKLVSQMFTMESAEHIFTQYQEPM